MDTVQKNIWFFFFCIFCILMLLRIIRSGIWIWLKIYFYGQDFPLLGKTSRMVWCICLGFEKLHEERLWGMQHSSGVQGWYHCLREYWSLVPRAFWTWEWLRSTVLDPCLILFSVVSIRVWDPNLEIYGSKHGPGWLLSLANLIPILFLALCFAIILDFYRIVSEIAKTGS